MKNAIEIQNLKKAFTKNIGLREFLRGRKESFFAINDVSLNIREGEIFGLLGHNGAGKTTIIKILTTLILPTDGRVKIYDFDIKKDAQEIKALIGLIHSDERSFFWRLNGWQNLEFFASIFRLPRKTAKNRIDELLHLVGLENDAHKIFHSYSTGMKQKLAIARGLLCHPKLLFMDEALRSIDPISTQRIRNFIKKEIPKFLGGTVVVATNRLDEAAQLCDRVAILKRGRIVECGSIDEIKKRFYECIDYEIEIKNFSDDIYERICRMNCIQNCEKTVQIDGMVGIEISMPFEEEKKLHFVLKEIIDNNGYIQRCIRKQPSLETVFTDIMGKTSETSIHEDNKI